MMVATKRPRKVNRMSDEAVKAKTGKTWDQWFAILDKAGAKELDHKGIVAIVSKHGVGPWWQQMVTVGYEQGRGLREKHQTPAGYHISCSRTVAASVPKVFAAWNNSSLRRRWLDDYNCTIRKATPNKSLRITWVDCLTGLQINFYHKGDSKCQVVVDHRKLSDAKAAKRMKEYWAKNLARLQEMLEG